MIIKKTVLGAAMLALILGVAGSAMARPHFFQSSNSNNWGSYGGCFMSGFNNFGQASGFSDEQIAEMQALADAHYQAIQPKEQELYAKTLELQALSGNTNAQPEYISALTAQIAALRAEINRANQDFNDELNDKFNFADQIRTNMQQMPMPSMQMRGPGQGQGMSNLRIYHHMR